MPSVLSKLLRVSSLSLAFVCALPSLANVTNDLLNKGSNSSSSSPEEKKKARYKNETMTVISTGNARDSFSVPMMVTVIAGDVSTSQGVSSAANMLRPIPGITLAGGGRTNGQDVSMRGYDNRGVLTLVDGVRQGIGAGHSSSIFLDPSLIKQAEIVRGPLALLYGGGALGGVVSY